MFTFAQYYFQKKPLGHHRRAESIFEVIIAITVISIGITAITLLVTSVMRANSISKEFIIANNLATEGLEVVSNLRESNWIEFPGYEEDCWNVASSVEDSGDCTDSSTKIGGTHSTTPRYFLIEIDIATNNWTLTQKKKTLTTNLDNDSQDDPYGLSLDTSTGLYTHDTNGPFYRMITIQYYDDNNTIDTSDDSAVAPTSGVYMDVVSIVRWKDRFNMVHNLRKTMRLFNHLAS